MREFSRQPDEKASKLVEVSDLISAVEKKLADMKDGEARKDVQNLMDLARNLANRMQFASAMDIARHAEDKVNELAKKRK